MVISAVLPRPDNRVCGGAGRGYAGDCASGDTECVGPRSSCDFVKLLGGAMASGRLGCDRHHKITDLDVSVN